MALEGRPGAPLALHVYSEKDFRMMPEVVTSGVAPLVVKDLHAGSYLVESGELRIPVVVEAGSDLVLTVPSFPTEREFVTVSAGAFRCGGDEMAPGALPASFTALDAFAIHRFPSPTANI